MADFLIRLIERSRGLAPEGRQVEPLIAPFYAAGPNIAPLYDEIAPSYDEMDNEMDEEMASIVEPEPHSSMSQRRDFPPRGDGAAFVQQSEENISIAPAAPRRRESRDKNTSEIKSALALTDGTQIAILDQNPGVEPLRRSTAVKSPESRSDERLGLTDQSRRADRKPLAPRPQPLARADDSNARASEAANKGETAASTIRVTIGRVDVRAVTASTPPPRRETPPAPKLSLEEYLRSRSGRKQ
jgi:hypothetical protein